MVFMLKKITLTATPEKGYFLDGQLVKIAEEHCTFWHTPEKHKYATITRNGHKEHYNLLSEGFTEW